jgi:hypothetical protein
LRLSSYDENYLDVLLVVSDSLGFPASFFEACILRVLGNRREMFLDLSSMAYSIKKQDLSAEKLRVNYYHDPIEAA